MSTVSSLAAVDREPGERSAVRRPNLKSRQRFRIPSLLERLAAATGRLAGRCNVRAWTRTRSA